MTICVSTVATSRSPWRHQIVQASDTHGSSGLPILLPQPDQDLVLQDFATDLGLRLPDRTIRGKVDVILRAVRVKGGLGVVNVGFDLWDVVRRECRGARGQSNRAISSMRMRKELAPLTWFTAGTMSADFNNNSRFSTEKFDTLPDTIPIRSVPTYRSTSPTDPLEVWTREEALDLPDRSTLATLDELFHLFPRLDESRGLVFRNPIVSLFSLRPVHQL
jgi:hypothetical protein